MRILTASLATETNSFSPIPTGWAAYQAFGIQRGSTGLQPGFATGPMLLWDELARADGHEIVHSVAAFAAPAGPTVRAVYETLRDEILADADAHGPFDMILLSLHGAMIAEGYDDCEGDLLARLREITPLATIGVELDPHCHLSSAMIENADLIVVYKEYPHTDIVARAGDLYRLVSHTAAGEIAPVAAVEDLRMVNLYFTQDQPLRRFVDRMVQLEGQDGVLSVSLVHGFPWGDVPENGTRILVYADGLAGTAKRIAAELASDFWAMRNETVIESYAIDAALDRALDAPPGIAVVADMADNTGGGAPGDSTFVLRRVLDRGLTGVAIGPLWDPVAVGFCLEAGLGARLLLRIGGKCSPASGDPLDLEIIVRGLNPSLATEAYNGEIASYGAAALVEVAGTGVQIVLTEQRMQAFRPEMFTILGLELTAQRILVVKSYNHFQTGFAAIAARIVRVSGPGAIDSDVASIPYRNRSLNYWPRVTDPFGKLGEVNTS